MTSQRKHEHAYLHDVEQRLLGWTIIFRDTNRHRKALKAIEKERQEFEHSIKNQNWVSNNPAEQVLAYLQNGGWSGRPLNTSHPDSKENYKIRYEVVKTMLGRPSKKKEELAVTVDPKFTESFDEFGERVLTKVLEGPAGQRLAEAAKQEKNMSDDQTKQTILLSQGDIKQAIQEWLSNKFGDGFEVSIVVEHYTTGIQEMPATRVKIVATRNL